MLLRRVTMTESRVTQSARCVFPDFMESATPFDIATCIRYTGVKPMSKKPVQVARNLRDRKLQRALMQFFKPENDFEVKETLLPANPGNLIGHRCDCLIPAQPPKEAIEARRKRENDDDHDHTVADPAKRVEPVERGVGQLKAKGYRPGRKSLSRCQKPSGGRNRPPECETQGSC
jgi:hypothetical protein